MVKATHLEIVGNGFKVYYEDGSTAQAYPTQGSIYRISGASNPIGGGGGGDGTFSYPYSEDYVTSEYGPRSGRFHEGRDWSGGPASNGPIPAIGDATVHNVFFSNGYGNCVDLFHGNFDGWDWYTRYAHMATTPYVTTGQEITKGTELGPIGQTGNSYGNHLHMEVHRVPTGGSMVNDNLNPSYTSSRTAINPVDFFNAYGDGAVLIP
jgi:murein DD-endopeptidase MepM/ murein hydrolase activator NlpD